MTSELNEAVPVAKLLGGRGETIGWIYFWNSTDLSVLWLSDVRNPKSIELVSLQRSRLGSDCTMEERINSLFLAILANSDGG